MLTTLNLKDFVIIEQLSLDLAEGFTVLTGETGAGKSILIDAIELVRGARGDSDLVRTGAERANIVAEFSLTDEARRWLQENALLEDGAENALVRLDQRHLRHALAAQGARRHPRGHPGPACASAASEARLPDEASRRLCRGRRGARGREARACRLERPCEAP